MAPRSGRAADVGELRTLVQDRTIRALMALVDDFIVERDESGLLRSTLEHVVQALRLSGGRTLLLGADDQLTLATEYLVPGADLDTTIALARRAIDLTRPAVAELADGGWLAATPLVARQRQLGALVLADHTPDSLAPDMELLQALGKQVGTGLENVRHYTELRASTERAVIVNRVTSTLAASMDMQVIVPAFALELRSILPFDRLACGFVNDSGDYIQLTTHPEDTTWGLGNVMPVVGSGPGHAVLNGTTVLQRDLLHDHRFIEDMRLLEEGIRSYLIVPLNARGRSIGVMALGSSEISYDEHTIARLQPLADAVALAFDNVRLFQKTRELSISDEVTPLYNFRFFHQILDRELKLVDRYHSELSLIFVDLDRFKPINDQWGHLRGSRVLREVGFLIRAVVRETDYPARYGGDEFVVILPQTERTAAVAVGEKLRALIEGHTFLQEEGINARIGVSLGVATYPGEARNKESLIRLADQRMYDDKGERKAGR
jgi:diguanylate cyclase (GGDEF)-like protein